MSASNGDLHPRSEETYGETPATSIADIHFALCRGWLFPVVGCLVGLTLAIGYILFAPALYRSSALVLIDLSVNRYLQTNRIVDEPTFHQAEIGNQIYIVSSESVVIPVIRSLNLIHDNEFVDNPSLGDGKTSNLKTLVKRFINWRTNPAAAMEPDSVERTALETFFAHLSVYREAVGNVININFTSSDPIKAANIANAIAESYIAITREAKYSSTKAMTQWLQDRLNELKEQAVEADRVLQDYKIANNLLGRDKGVLSSDELLNLSQQLSSARLAAVEAKARLDRIRKYSDEEILTAAETDLRLMLAANNTGNAGSLNFALNNTDIVKLRSEYRELVSKMTEVELRVGRQHEVAIKTRNKLDELRNIIRQEGRRIIDSYASEYEVVKEREDELAGRMTRLVGENAIGNQAQVKMRELESSAATVRSLYNSFLQKYSEINTIQTESVPVQDARIIARAVPELRTNYKKAVAVLAGGIILGLCFGAGAAVAREWIADVFRTPKAVEQVTEIPSVILPMVKAKRERAASFWHRRRSLPLEEFILDAPYSRFTETLRNVKASIDATWLAPSAGAKVIGVVSSVAKEGKTTIAANLAALIIASSGARTLIIDADLHRRLLTASLAPDVREGLIEALDDPSRLTTLISKRERSGLDVLPCALSARVPNAAELLGSPKMEQLLDAARKYYDYIIIEIAPIMSVVDVKMIGRFIDRFIFVVEWGKTKRSVVLEALSELGTSRERVAIITLNQADPFALRTIESYKGNRFREYYED